ncbi:MAG: response regulator [bacterium]
MFRVLVVDDEKLVRWTLKNSLENAGYAATAVEDADTAIRILKTGDFELVISDVKLIGMSGLELLSHIRQTRPGLPVILITAYGNDNMRQEARSRGAAAFFDKPFDVESLLDRVEDLCKSQ